MITQVIKSYVHSFADSESAQFAADESSKAHRYYNALMELRLAERRRYREIRSELCPALLAAENELAGINTAIDKMHDDLAAARQAVVGSGGKKSEAKLMFSAKQREQLAELTAARKGLSVTARECRDEFQGTLAPAQREYDRRTSGASVQLIAQIEELGKQLKAAKKIRNNPDVAQLQRAHDKLKLVKKQGAPQTAKKRDANLSAWEAMKDEPWPDAWKALKALEMETHAGALALRAKCELFHGTYVAVEDAVKKAFEDADGDPGFRRWDGGRKIGLQIQGGCSWADILAGKCTLVRVSDQGLPRGRRDGGGPVSTNAERKVFVEVRLGTKPDRWVKARALLHRPVPTDAMVTWVYLVPREGKWSVQFTLNLEKPLIQRAVGQGVVSVSPCWHMRDGRLVGGLANGEPVYVTGNGDVPNGWITDGLAKARSLRAASDTIFEGSKDDPMRGAKTKMIAWMAEHPELVPAWMVEATAAVPATETRRARGGIQYWRRHELLGEIASRWARSLESLSIERIGELWREWRKDRDAVGEEHGAERGDYHADERAVLDVFLAARGIVDEAHRMAIWLEWWRMKDAHLRDWAKNLDNSARASRKQHYQVEAARLSRTFERAEISDVDIASLAKRKKTGDDEDESTKSARNQRTVAAPSEFIDAVKAAFGKERYKIIKRERSADDGNTGGARKTTKAPKNKPEEMGDQAAE